MNTRHTLTNTHTITFASLAMANTCRPYSIKRRTVTMAYLKKQLLTRVGKGQSMDCVCMCVCVCVCACVCACKFVCAGGTCMLFFNEHLRLIAG